MFRPVTEKPRNPKNGDRYIDMDGNPKIFKYGTWHIEDKKED